ncbi:carbonic anhydrase [Inmirania thermothiophila]|uniref:carbonic anhydrase n=1 Tax=Inmirania thermothiophila TaxID=1750597 RepID=A0A3N1Y0Y6_9GAMM|nr:carbonic anhydrase [Inmirania thermothiophila]ROR32503.1 carbonic anhydrase [Inmirania thermothiophila]
MTRRLLDGFARFRRGLFDAAPGRARALAQGQQPAFAVIACSDARVDPALLFDAGPGELFVIRHVAALVPPHDDPAADALGAALEVAVETLGVGDLVVLGHARCAGVAAWAGGRASGRLGQWMAHADAARRTAGCGDEADPACWERAVVMLSVARLAAYPVVAHALAAGRLRVHGWRYDLVDGRIETLSHRAGTGTTAAGSQTCGPGPAPP